MALEPTKDKPRLRKPLLVATVEVITSSKTAEIVSKQMADAQRGASSTISTVRASPSIVSRRAVVNRPLDAIEELGDFEVD
jgi:hypothetical protein